MEALASTSFDRFARYTYTYRLRTESLPSAPLRILDVGDPYGTLAALFPDDLTVSLDLFSEGAPGGDAHQHLIGSGFTLPFADGTFDLVTAHDVLEHVPAAGRNQFVDELARVARGPVVVVAPFADARTSACERVVNAYYVAHVGETLDPLDEHAAEGLPDLDALAAHLTSAGLDHIVHSDGWLYHWLAFMILKAHYVNMGAAALDRATDAAFNRLLRERDARPPHYRRAIIIRPPADFAVGSTPPPRQSEGEVEAERAELERLGWELVKALPRGEDPGRAGSAFRDFLADAATRGGVIAELAASVTSVLDEAARALAPTAARQPTVRERRAPTVTAVVLHRPGAPIERAVDALQASGVVSSVRRPPDDATDDALQLALAVADMDTDAMLIVDPTIDVDAELVRALVDAYGPESRCVGYHRHPDRAPEPVVGLRPHDDDALYVARELLLVDRDLYRGLGGLDGRFRGQLDDVDFGWRANLLGHAVTTVGPAPWAARTTSPLSLDVAVLWCWLKNLDRPALEHALGTAALALIGGGLPTDSDIDPFEDLDGLLRARADIARIRAIEDEVIFERFGALTLPLHAEPERRRQQVLLRDALPHRLPPARSRSTVIFVADDQSHDRFAALAESLAATSDAVLATPRADDGSPTSYRAIAAEREDDLLKLVEHADVLVVPGRLLAKHRRLGTNWTGVVVVDLADAGVGAWLDIALRRGDVFLCDSAHQRDHWLARLAGHGRAAASDNPADDLVRIALAPTSAPGARVPRQDGAGGGVISVVVDLAGIDSRADLADAFAEQFVRAFDDDVARLVVVGPEQSRDRLDAIRRAAVVVRPTPDELPARLAPAAPGADALASATPIVTTWADPIGSAVSSFDVGVVTGSDASALLDGVRRVLADATIGARARDAAARLRSPEAARPLVDVVHQPWRWRFGHAGGVVPLTASPAVAELLALHEAEVVRAVTESVTADVTAELTQRMVTGESDLATTKQRLRELQDELHEARAEVDRIRSHPIIRLLMAVRRALRPA